METGLMSSNFQDEVLELDTYSIYISDFFIILVTSGQVNFRPGPLQFTTLGGNYSFAHNFWTKGDGWMKWVAKCLPCGPESNGTQYDQFWPDLTSDPKLGRGQILKLFFFTKLGITRFVSTRVTWWCQIRCCRSNSLEDNVEKRKVWKIALDPKHFDP